MKKEVNIPLNRVEGDLEIRIAVDNGHISQARSIGTMFRGFEEMMLGRAALDGLVITPRICGICSLTHLNAAAEALDAISGVVPPDNAHRLRNIALMAETIQNDIRHSALMFMADFAQHQAYSSFPFFEEALVRYDPITGRIAHQVIKETKKMPQIVAIIGGQWPHTSFMVPGGVASMPDATRILQCKMITQEFRSWYEQLILGCSLARWQEVQSVADLTQWLAEKKEHRESEVGFLIRCLQEAKIADKGGGPNRFLSYGNFTLPINTQVHGHGGRFFASGFAEGTYVQPFDQRSIQEDLSCTRFTQENGPLHPFQGTTVPGPIIEDRDRYSWVKAPRYDGKVAETGPLAEMIINGQPLFLDLVRQQGPNILARQLARLIRPSLFFPAMSCWLDELVEEMTENFITKVDTIPNGEAAGLIHAARGALGHWVKIVDETITQYQIITPTAWNGSPRDGQGQPGAWEQALLNTPIRNPDNPIEAGHVIRSFDPCMVCAVHTVKKSAAQYR